ncbi:hypothetical protein FRC01_012748, partial [Tulasnella sp. 417]
MPFCTELSTTGTCTRVNCTSSHDSSLYCEDCNIICGNHHTMGMHLKGKHHRKVLRNRAALSDGICWVCNMTIGTHAAVWESHTSGRRHQNNLDRLGASAFQAGPPDSDSWCNVCRVNFPDRNAARSHRRGDKHKRRVAAAEAGAKIKDSQQSKHGVAISHETGLVDFPFIDIPTLADQPVRTMEISIAASFYVGVTPPIRLHVDDTFNLPVIFEAGDLRGYFSDTVELGFDNTESGQEWKVSRTLRATVGVAADYALLRPTAPYVRRPRRTVVHVQAPLPGPVPPSRATIPYIRALPPYPLEDAFATIGQLEQRIATVRSMLPTTLNGSTYKDFWRALLFVEEQQMRTDIEEYDLLDVSLEDYNKNFR